VQDHNLFDISPVNGVQKGTQSGGRSIALAHVDTALALAALALAALAHARHRYLQRGRL
jgi:hypothetical protein